MSSDPVHRRPAWATDTSFFLGMAIAMAAINVTAFSFFAAMGMSSFRAPLYIHAHAVLFMGWVVLFVTQAWLAASGRVTLHRPLGWLAVGWALVMVVVGTTTTIFSVQRGFVPFFFTPAQFLVLNPLSVLVFAGLLIAGFVRRRDRLWHPRLILCAMAAIMGPAFGRLLPAPLFMYSMVWAIFVAMIAFPLIGAARDRIRRGRVHPAWLVGLVALMLMQLGVVTIGRSAWAAGLHAQVTAGTPGAAMAADDYPPPPFPVAP
ncbi:hypothetical protein PK98_10080 [Croceibacterium mercuriale]|uniref:Uncharacterized protein n=1 Tax=Croceibacterium mercuriale TaxID=1572751 RepID=A0A0B2BZB0_9SPHN|nr:hypothetical protein PK98_10080 [Croceibacterium mercuriale]